MQIAKSSAWHIVGTQACCLSKVSAARPGIPGPGRTAELSCPTVPSACGHMAFTCLLAAPASPLHGDRSASLSSRGKTASTAGPSHTPAWLWRPVST